MSSTTDLKATDAKAPVKSTEKSADAAAANTSDVKRDAANKSDSKKDTPPESRPRRARKSQFKAAAEAAPPVKKYVPKLMTEENEDEKTVLIKISRATTVRQVINYSIGKIKNDWKVTFNAFQMEISKVLVAAEIIKTRLPFLHQENKLITYTGKPEAKPEEGGEEKAPEKVNVRSGIQVTLSRNQFEVTEPAGYQKPKPRQFLQPMPSKQKNQAEEKENYEHSKDDLKRRKSPRNQRRRSKKQQRAESYEDRDDSDPKNQKGGAKRNEERKKGIRKSQKEQKQKSRPADSRSYSDERWRRMESRDRAERDRNERDRYDPMPAHQRRGGPPLKQFDSDYDHDRRPYGKGPGGHYRQHPDRFRGSSIEFEQQRPQHYYRGGPPPQYSRDGHMGGPPRYQSKYQLRGGPQGGGMRSRGGPPPRGGYNGPRDYERPERPGYYAGNRPFRMDKIRDQPLENLHHRADNQIERERMDRVTRNHQQRDVRDMRNKPAQIGSRD